MDTEYKLIILLHLLLITGSHGNDLLALLSFKSSISQDPHQALASWNNSSPNYCNWYGVKCSLRHLSRVIELKLDYLDIAGTISPAIANLTFLHKLSLSYNRLHGHIPRELGYLRRLRSLYLGANLLTDEIPSTLSQCSQLKIISLRNNNLHGEVPSALSKCIGLEIISLSNNFLDGSLPSDFTSLKNLRHLLVRNNNLTGTIPSSIGNISSLNYLDLSGNMIVGTIPPSLTRLSSLTNIFLNKNSLTGSIPSFIGNLSSLDSLYISNNHFTGELPSSLRNLTSLTRFSVGYNSLSRVIPSWLGDLSMLGYLNLQVNYFSGSIPPSLGILSSLIILNLYHNQLSGKIPPSLFNISSIEYLEFSENQLSDTLPQDLGNFLPYLLSLSMYSNNFQGPIPTNLANATKLEHIDLSRNDLTGNIPSNLGNLQALSWLDFFENELEATSDEGWSFLTSLQNCSQLGVLDIGMNKFGGALPKSIGNLSKSLHWFNLMENQISGTLPAEIENLDGLEILYLHENKFEGNIPFTIGKLQNLHSIALYNNKFSGSIPSSFGNLTKLIKIYMFGNTIEGSIPRSLGECKALEILDLSRNRLTGAIPKEILSLESLSQLLDLSNNLFSGFLPLEVGSLKNLKELRVAFNHLSGEIPRTIGECTILEILHMESNQFQGTIPHSLSNLKGLQVLDISQNNLSGIIPIFLEDFILMNYLNLSFNNFEGEVPSKGIFIRNVSGISLRGNDRLCGGDPRLKLSPCPSQKHKRTHATHRLKAILSISISALLLFLLVCLLAFRHWLHNRTKETPASYSMKELYVKVSFSELLKATNGFASENLIGAGTFGCVYKGIINFDEQLVVAIKVLNLEKHGASKSFEAECNVLSKIRHRNLVKIISSCSSIDYKGKDFKALIFEYMPNGSLEKWLHPQGQDQNIGQSLSLIQRLNIAIDVASALDYLHHHGPTPIVHCDLKPSNILLDDDMTAHVGDFGLARFIAATSRLSHDSSMSIGIKGTIGYVPPEYGMTNQVSVAGDIYSYGIFLLELLTAKRPTDASIKNGENLHIFVQNAMPEHAIDIIDPFLIFEGREDSVFGRVKRQECFTSILKIGLFCSMESPRERIEIEVAIKELHSIRNKFLITESR